MDVPPWTQLTQTEKKKNPAYVTLNALVISDKYKCSLTLVSLD